MKEQENQIPANALIEQHPADTLMNIQSIITFLQDYTTKNIEEPEDTYKIARINSGHYVLLKMIEDALEYEINRIETPANLTIIN